MEMRLKDSKLMEKVWKENEEQQIDDEKDKTLRKYQKWKGQTKNLLKNQEEWAQRRQTLEEDLVKCAELMNQEVSLDSKRNLTMK